MRPRPETLPANAPARPTAGAARRAGGFTLLELMVTLTVVGVVIGVGVPSMRTMMLNNSLTAVSNDLLASLLHARTEAIKRQANVVLCASADSTAVAPTCTNGAANAWIVFQDSNGNWQADANETILERHPAINASILVRSDNQPVVSFASSGFAAPAGPQVPMRNIVFCDSRGVHPSGATSTARAVVISATGRARVVSANTDVLTALAATGGTCP